jgi:hypothetical protein
MKKECFVCREHSFKHHIGLQRMPNFAMVIAFVLLLSSFLSACTSQASLIPHALYYLEGWEEEAQIWKLEKDGISKRQLTFEPGGINAFSVSKRDGSLAFVSNNRLFVTDPEGNNKRLIADASNIDNQIEDYHFHGIIDRPVFSPDGQFLAYAFDGLHIYNFSTEEDKHILRNLGNLLDEPYVFTKEAYYPESWSSDGNQLLFLMGYYEGSTLAIMEMGEDITFRRLLSDGPVCCLYSWTPENTHILVANPYFNNIQPGLWRYDVKTGEKISLISDDDQGGNLNFVGWPNQLSSGAYYFFYHSTDRFSPEEGVPLSLGYSLLNGFDIEQVRPEKFQIRELLWVKDEPKAIIVGRTNEDNYQLIYLPAGQDPLQVIIDEAQSIHNLTWGL